MSRRAKQSRRLTMAGLIAISAATLLMMAWAAFPAAAYVPTDHLPLSHSLKGGTTTTAPPQTSTTTTTVVSPTSVTSTATRTTTIETPVVAPTTVTPTGTAFTGIENVVPLGAIALMLMTGGSGLLWAGSRRKRRSDEAEDE